MLTNSQSLFKYVESFLVQKDYILENSKTEFFFDQEKDEKILINFHQEKKHQFLLKNFNEFSNLNLDFLKLMEKEIDYIIFIKDYFEIFVYKIEICEKLI